MAEITEERVREIVEEKVRELVKPQSQVVKAVAKPAPKTAKRRPLFKKRASKDLLTKVVKAVLPDNKS